MKKLLVLSVTMASFFMLTQPVWSAESVDSASIGYQLGYKQGQVEHAEGIETQDPKAILDSPMFQGGYRLFADEYGLNDSEFRESFATGFYAGYSAPLESNISFNTNQS